MFIRLFQLSQWEMSFIHLIAPLATDNESPISLLDRTDIQIEVPVVP